MKIRIEDVQVRGAELGPNFFFASIERINGQTDGRIIDRVLGLLLVSFKIKK